jgi:enoyl-CoA hydratase
MTRQRRAESTVIVVEELSPGVWRARLDSSQDRNALSGEMRQAIMQGLREARSAGAKVMIVRGSSRVFSSGYRLDPGTMSPSTVTQDRSRLLEVTEFMRAYRAQPVVTIAEVRGYCVAGGTDLMLASDISLVAADASIGVPNVRGVGITLLLPLWSWLAGPQRAKLLALTGDFVTGEEAAQWGLAAAALPSALLEKRVLALAERIALIPEELLEVTKNALNVAWDTAGMDTALIRAAELDALSHATRPVKEFWERVVEGGIRKAVDARDSGFREGRTLDLLTVPPAATAEPEN